MKLIDADKIRYTWMVDDDGEWHDGVTLQSVINKLPIVDAVEVVHGEWIYHECVSSFDGTINGYSCSKCNVFVDEEIFDMDEFHKYFCGHCGAKMDGERKEKLKMSKFSKLNPKL